MGIRADTGQAALEARSAWGLPWWQAEISKLLCSGTDLARGHWRFPAECKAGELSLRRDSSGFGAVARKGHVCWSL